METANRPIMRCFSDIPDPRKETNKKYPLDEVAAITIKKADYLFSLKGNQGNLHEDAKEYAD